MSTAVVSISNGIFMGEVNSTITNIEGGLVMLKGTQSVGKADREA